MFFDVQDLFHTTSLIRYPIMVGANKKNYDGRKPDMMKNPFISERAKQSITYEVANLPHLQLIIPLGQSVEDFLTTCFKEHSQVHDTILKGLPHPSGINAHRPKIFEQNKESLKRQIKLFYDRIR